MELRLLEKLMLSLIFIIIKILKYQAFSSFIYIFFNIPFASTIINKNIKAYIMTDNRPNAQSNVSEFNRFLNNNTAFIYEKYYLYFEQPVPITKLKSEEYNSKCLKFIYDIFSFQKYQSNPKLNNTLRKGLTSNIQSFVSLMQQKEPGKQFDRDASASLLKYCIENNDMFAVHYDRKSPKKTNVEQPKKQAEKPKEDIQNEPYSPKLEQKPMVNEKQESQNPQPVQIKEPYIEKEEPIAQKDKNYYETSGSNEFENAVPIKTKEQNIQLIHRQLRTVFQFYCKQQQNVTPNSTFESINHKCQTMNLGKFLYFAVAANIVQSREKPYSQARIDKKTVMSIFKRLAEGQREINIKVFLAIMDELHKNDETIFVRMGLGQQGSKGKSKVIQNLKYFNLPFYTRDLTGREKSPHGRQFIPKLTTHSGKVEEALRQELVSRKERPNYQSYDRIKAQSKTIFRNRPQSKVPQQAKDSTKFTLKLGESHDSGQPQNLKFLSKLITHEENDQIFLKDYHLPSKKNSGLNKQKGYLDESIRYTKQQQPSFDRPLDRSQGDYTSRTNKIALILPLIKQKKNQGILTERRSLGNDKKTGYKF